MHFLSQGNKRNYYCGNKQRPTKEEQTGCLFRVPPLLEFGRDSGQAEEWESSLNGKKEGWRCALSGGLLHGEAVGGLPGSGASYAMVGDED